MTRRERQRRVRTSVDRGARAFFDLDRTLMAGSSGIFFVRAAYETGMITRAAPGARRYENLRFRLRGSTDDAPTRCASASAR